MKKSYFISDIHLGAAYQGNSRRREKLVVEFLDSICVKADRLFLVGDILDYWYEYRTVVPRGYVRFFGALARLADAGVKITWFIGNHDIWLFDYLKTEIGIEIVDGFQKTTIDGKKFLITHGDGVGHLDPGFRLIRAIFRNKFCQTLYSAIHPRWTVPFAHRWSAHSRSCDSAPDVHLSSDDPFLLFAREQLAEDPSINYFVFGHRHILLQEKISDSSEIIVLGDWLDHFSYGEFDGHSFTLHRFSTDKS